jgi:hypothetical protein
MINSIGNSEITAGNFFSETEAIFCSPNLLNFLYNTTFLFLFLLFTHIRIIK